MTFPETKNSSLLKAVQKYRHKRENVHRAVLMDLRQSGTSTKFHHVTLTEITERALEFFEQNWVTSGRRVSWNWREELVKWKTRRPSHWEMAIWHRQTLCGLVLGGPSRRRSRLYVEGIEGYPAPHPLKRQIIPVALIAAERYAVDIGCKEIWLVDPGPLLDLYVKAGYHLRPPNKFLAKVLRLKAHAVKTLHRG